MLPDLNEEQTKLSCARGLTAANQAIRKVLQGYEADCRSAERQIERLIPIGAVVRWTTQRGSQKYEQTGTVAAHRRDPNILWVRNTRTGKCSNVYTSSEDFVLLERPY